MTTIRVTSRNAAGVAVPRAKVTVTLVAGPRPTDPGFVIDDNHTIVTGSQHLTNQAGNLELDLASTDDGEMDPPGCFYLITAAGAKRTIEVPATGDYDWGDPDIALIDPASPEAAHGIPTGGTDGQVLTKVGTTPYATAWEDAVVEPWKYVGEAGEIPFDDGWGNDPSLSGTIFSTLRYRLEGDVVRVEGCVSGGTPDPTGVTGVATLPAGYRPAFVTTIGGAISIDPTDFSLGAAVLGINPGGTLSVASAAESAVLYSATFVAV